MSSDFQASTPRRSSWSQEASLATHTGDSFLSSLPSTFLPSFFAFPPPFPSFSLSFTSFFLSYHPSSLLSTTFSSIFPFTLIAYILCNFNCVGSQMSKDDQNRDFVLESTVRTQIFSLPPHGIVPSAPRLRNLRGGAPLPAPVLIISQFTYYIELFLGLPDFAFFSFVFSVLLQISLPGDLFLF